MPVGGYEGWGDMGLHIIASCMLATIVYHYDIADERFVWNGATDKCPGVGWGWG